jgi:hypothetical protein
VRRILDLSGQDVNNIGLYQDNEPILKFDYIAELALIDVSCMLTYIISDIRYSIFIAKIFITAPQKPWIFGSISSKLLKETNLIVKAEDILCCR